jgi:large repetitive protein
VLMVFQATAPNVAPPNGVYAVTVVTGTSFTIIVPSGSGSGTFVGTRQNAGLSTAHVGVNSAGPSTLTVLYGDPDVAEFAVVPFDLTFNVTNLQYFLAPPGAPGEARPSLWLQLVEPFEPHVGPAGALTNVPVVYRQYPTPPTLVSQSWANYVPNPPSGNPIADGADWSYLYTYQAFLAAQDQINSAVTYNTDLSAAQNSPNNLKALGVDDGPYDLFNALARNSAVTGQIQSILQDLANPLWATAIETFATSVVEVTKNTTWNPPLGFAAALGLANITDNYVVTDTVTNGGQTQQIQISWEAAQGESSFAGVSLSLTALDPASKGLMPYPNQAPISPTEPNSLLFQVNNAPVGGLGVAHLIGVNALNVLAAENALAAVQVERNLITLTASDGSSWQAIPEFIYMTPLVRPSQPVTPFIDSPTPIDTATLPSQGLGAACPASPSSLCQRIYTIMANLLADPVQSKSLLAAHVAANVTEGTTRRVKVGCSYSFPVSSVTGGAYNAASISPLVPIVLARSFDIDGHQTDQIGDFSALFAAAIDTWAANNSIIYGPNALPAGAMLVFDITLYAALSGVDTPVLRFSNLQLNLTDIDPV